VQYTHFDVATDLVWIAGRSCYLSKVDIKHAFRLLPVRQRDWILLGYFWEGYYFVDTRLPFGLRSSPGIFNQFADLVCWVIQNVYGLSNLIHYADDFFLVSSQNLQVAVAELNILCKAFQDLQIPLAKEKIIGPTKQIIYLGIEINSDELSISIPDDKYKELMISLPKWLYKRNCTKQQLLSIIGKLSFVCKVVRPGRIFLRRLINLSMTVDKLHHHIDLNKQALADFQWWLDFLPSWNKKSVIPESFEIFSSDIKLYTDASNIGFGAILNNSWIQGKWDSYSSKLSIDYKELFAIVAAAMTWGHLWEGRRIIFITDNLPIVQIWNIGTTPSVELMKLVRKLYLLAAKTGFSVSLKHIYGNFNPVADAISRFQENRFRQLMPHADLQPTKFPETIWNQ
jgi:hypothetical protein